MLSDLRFAVRQSLKSPALTTAIVATLALGIGATTAIFSLVNTTFLRPLPYPDADRLVFIDEASASSSGMSVSYPNFLDWRAQQDSFSALALYHVEGRTLKTDDVVEQVSTGLVTSDFFAVLGSGVTQGRALSADDDRPGATPVVWLTHAAWQRYFSGRASLVGQNLSLGNQALTVAGILPADFRFPRHADFFLALTPYAESLFMTQRQNHNDAYAVGRLRPGATLEQARAQLDAIGQRIEQQYPESNTGIRPHAVPLRERLAGAARPQLSLLLGAVGLLLLLTCVNIANMLLARSFVRDREMAVRTVLGAARWQLVRQLLVESLLFAAAGGVIGCLLGWWGYDLALRLVPWEVQAVTPANSGLDARVLLFVCSLTVLTGFGFGLAPAWRLSHTNPNDALKNTPRFVRTLLGRFRLTDVLVVAQVALALMLLIGAGLMMRSLQQLTRIDPGFRPAQVLTLKPAPPSMTDFLKDPLATSRYYEDIGARVQQLPGVEAAGCISSLAFTGANSWMTFFRTDRPLPAAGEFVSASIHSITPGYFHTMGVPLQRGRLFDGREPTPAIRPGVPLNPGNLAEVFKGLVLDAVVSQRMTERFWPGEDPIGKRFQLGFPNMQLPVAQIVGVVGNTTQYGLDAGEPPELYLSIRQFPTPTGMHLVVRSPLDPATLVPMLRSAIRAVSRDQPILDIKPMAARIGDSIDGRRFNMILFTAFAGIALLLALLGIYGVLAFVVTRRTRELGIRMALGARRGQVLRNVIWRGFSLVLLGATLGLAGAWSLSRLLQSQLFGVTATDPFTYAAGAVLLLLAALAACFLPARRATQVNPAEALRAE